MLPGAPALPAQYPAAKTKTFPRWPGSSYTDTNNIKVVWHTTQGSDGGLFSTYKSGGGIPHFTIMLDGTVYQHYSTHISSRALRNASGGVQTNRDGAIQIEIVGYSGRDHTQSQREAITALAAWFTKGGVSPTFPMGRLSKPYRRATNVQWDHGEGHWAHGMIPENNHTDPDMTEPTWGALVRGVTGKNEIMAGEPDGHLDGLTKDGTSITGWAVDPDLPMAAVEIHVHEFDLGGKVIGGIAVGRTGQGVNRPDVVAYWEAKGVTVRADCGYSIPIPAGRKRIAVYGINVNGTAGGNVMISGGIKDFTFDTAPAPAPAPAPTPTPTPAPTPAPPADKNVANADLIEDIDTLLRSALTKLGTIKP